jgi:uncharacterized YigZ family protein
MTRTDEFLTVKDKKRSKLKVKGSIFIAAAFPVKTKDEVETKLGETKKEFFDATHNCYAYKIGLPPAEISKSGDAGEPKGTAGKPILSAIQARNLTNVLIIVTRYFGGIKLGKGGLSRAYHQSALEVLNLCESVKKFPTSLVTFNLPLSYYGKANLIIEKFDAKVIEKDFSEGKEMKIKVEIRRCQLEEFKRKITDLTDGEVRFVSAEKFS